MSISVNGPRTPVTAGSNGIAAATVPNVCKMPGPPPFVPTPLPNIGKSGDTPKKYSKTVTFEGHAVAIRGATFNSQGDIASKATGGGLISSNTHGPTSFVGPGSMNVKIEGKNVQLLSDPMLNNNGPSGSPPNSATLVGVLQAPGDLIAVFGDEPCPLCHKVHGAEGRLEETTETKGAVEDVKKAIEGAREAAQTAERSARILAIDAAIAELSVGLGDLTRRQRAPINTQIEQLKREKNSLDISFSAMMGAAKCKCGQTYAGTSMVQYKDVVRRYSHHAPRAYFSLLRPPNKSRYHSRRYEKFASLIASDKQAAFKRLWKQAKRRSDKSRQKASAVDEVAYPPGSCAAQLMVLLAMQHKCRPIGVTERMYRSPNGPKLQKLKVRDLGEDGVPGPPRYATDEELSGDNPIPPCKNCQIILQMLLCPDDKGLQCAHSVPPNKACQKCK